MNEQIDEEGHPNDPYYKLPFLADGLLHAWHAAGGKWPEPGPEVRCKLKEEWPTLVKALKDLAEWDRLRRLQFRPKSEGL